MANPHRGQVAFIVDGTAYTMRLSSNALCDLEGILQRSALAAFTSLAVEPEVRTVRAIVWAALSESRPGITLAEAGTIIDAVGFVPMMEKLTELVALTYPKAEGAAAPENPQ